MLQAKSPIKGPYTKAAADWNFFTLLSRRIHSKFDAAAIQTKSAIRVVAMSAIGFGDTERNGQ